MIFTLSPGSLRKENISKGYFDFAKWPYIEQELNRILSQLSYEAFLQGLDKENLAKRLAYYMAELNVLHPFREGNGRVIREFIRQLALKNGYILNLTNTEPIEIYEASRESVVNTENLEKILFKCLDKKS